MRIRRSVLIGSAVFLSMTAACSLFIDTDDLGGREAPASLNDGGGPPAAQVEGGAGLDGDVAPTCIADLKNDTKNCGVCGRDCLGGGCSDGRCQPAEFAKVVGVPWYMTSDDEALYVITRNTENQPTDGDIVRVEKSTRQVTVLAENISPAPFDVKVDASFVYWTAAFDSPATTVQRRSKFPNGDKQISTLASLSYGLELVLVPNRVIVSGWLAGKVYSIPITGGSPTEITGAPFFKAEGLATDGTNVFVASKGTSAQERGQIARINASAPGAAQVSHLDSWGRRIAVGGDYLFGVADANFNVVKKADNSQQRSFTLSSNSFPGTVIYDETSQAAYLANSGGDAIFKSPGPDFMTLEPFATNQGKPIGLASDAKAIYWASARSSSVGVLVK